MEKRLIISIVCVFIFFALFLATLPMTAIENMEFNQNELNNITEEEIVTPEERLEQRTNRLRSQTDTNIYRIAISTRDRTKCSSIQNHVLRQDCVANTKDISLDQQQTETQNTQPSRQVSSEDKQLYRIAVSKQDSDLCQDIIDSDYRQECMEMIR